MLAAGTADSDRQITSPFPFETGYPLHQEIADLLQHPMHLWVGAEEVRHGLVFAGLWPQFRVPVRVRQAACIEHEIGIAWNAVFETERLQHHRHLFAAAFCDAGANDLAQFMQRGPCRIHLEMGKIQQGIKHLAFQFDRFFECAAVLGERMAPPGLAEALNQDAVVGVEKDDLAVHPMVTQAFDQPWELGQLGAGTAGVYADGRQGAGLRRLHGYIAYQGLEQADRQVINTVEADVFKDVQRNTFA